MADEVETLCDGFRRKTFEKIPKAVYENLIHLRKMNILVENEISRIERILKVAPR